MITDNLPEPNIPLLRKAVEWAEAEAAKTDGTGLWNQAWYAEQRECGTAYCIAGFAIMAGLSGAKLVDGYELEVDGNDCVSWFDTGRAALGLTENEAYALFNANNSIAEVREVAEQIAARAGERL